MPSKKIMEYQVSVSLYFILSGVSGSIVICISPLTSLMMDQVAKYKACGLKAEYIGYTQTSAQAKKSVLNGEVQLVFCTPESSMMLSSLYKEKLVCVLQWMRPIV